MTDHSLAFWQSIAGVFGTQATPPTSSYGTIKNTAILFELFNEPFADTVGVYTAGHSNAYDLMLNGGTPLSDPQPYQVASCPAVNYGGQKGVPTYRTQTVNVYGPGAIPNPITGFQPVMNAIRGIGAANVCLIGSSGFSGNVCQFKSWFPTDPIAGTPQLGAVWHTYGTNFPFTGGAAIGFGNGASDGTSGTTNAFVPVATGATTSPIANGYPVINTEFAGYSNPWLYATPDPLSTWFLGQFDKYGMGGTLFQFNLPQPGGSFTGSLTAGGVLTVTANPQNILFTTGYQHPIFGPGLPAPTAANTFGTWVSSIANGPPVVLTLSNSSVTAASGTYYLGYANNSFSDAGFGLLGGFGATQSQLIPAYGDKATIFNWMTTHA
jgi:hypothetical protein